MYILLASFFISLFGIVGMVARKLALAGEIGMSEVENQIHPLAPDIEKIKYATHNGLKRFSYFLLVFIIRSYIRFVKFLKRKYDEVKKVIKNMVVKNTANPQSGESVEQEVSGFLKKVLDYKRKIRNIKHKIKEEEEEEVV
ncbi:hypothetical protein HZA26_01595 [Candidatus Nomurabacteria bacterium]|nr:hypothetical protein [Candidatus Nomurabacteria bacterium]